MSEYQEDGQHEQLEMPFPRELARVYLATETTGSSPGDIIKVGIVGDDGTVLLDARCRPTCEITEEAHRVHGISLDDLEAEPPSSEIKARTAEIISGKHVIIYHAAFDRRFLDLSGAATVSCAMLEFSDYMGYWSEYWGACIWQTLQTATEAAEHAWSAAQHGAVADALACRAVWQALPRLRAAKEATEARSGWIGRRKRSRTKRERIGDILNFRNRQALHRARANNRYLSARRLARLTQATRAFQGILKQAGPDPSWLRHPRS